MKTFLIALLFLLAGAACLQAQTVKTYKVKPGERVDYALLKENGLYQYPQFADAQVALKNGTSGTVRMNYNLLLGEMQFINGKGDTLSLDKENEVASIVIAKDTFVFSDGYVQLLDGTRVRFGKKTMLKIANRQRIGGMGEVTDGNTMYSTMYSKYGVKDLVTPEAITFYAVSSYFIGDRFDRFKPLNRKSLHSFYARQDKEVEAYLQANPVNFNQEADVLRLMAFLKTL